MREKYGPIEQKILLTLVTGGLLLLNPQMKRPWRIINAAIKEWQGINERSMDRAVKRLYESKLVSNKKNTDGTIKIILSKTGREKALIYNLDAITIKKPKQWDGLWHIVMFDIPEHKKKGRDALAGRLKILGLRTLQKSVFIHPYECAEEVNFITEVFQIRPYVQMMIVKNIDNEYDLKKKFELL